MQYQYYIIIIVCVLLLSMLVWKEIKRPNKARLVIRILAEVVTVAGLAGLVLPISWHAKIGKENTPVAVLLTDGYNEDSVSQFKKEHPGSKAYTWIEYLNGGNAGETLHVFGYGLNAAQWRQLPVVNVIQHPIKEPEGIIAINWPAQVIAGQPLILQGTYNNTGELPVQILLTGFGEVMDSVSMAPGKKTPFTVQCLPRQSGPVFFELKSVRKRDTITIDPVPVLVTIPETMSVLVLAASPSFENRFLINWLAENGYPVAARSAVSNGKYDQSLHNQSAISLEKITPALLDKMQVVITDNETIQSLSANERALLFKKVADDGLGLVLRTDSLIAFNEFRPGITIGSAKDSAAQLLTFQLPATEHFLKALPVKEARYLHLNAGAQPFITDRQSKVYAAALLQGAGKVIVTTLTETFSWTLNSNQTDYSQYWTSILQKVARNSGATTHWQLSSQMPRLHEPVEVSLMPADNQYIPVLHIEKVPVYLRQTGGAGASYAGTWWPQYSGWQTAVTNNNDTCRWFVYPDECYRSVDQLRRQIDTKDVANAIALPTAKSDSHPLYASRQLSKLWFFIAFILGCTFLWIERKI